MFEETDSLQSIYNLSKLTHTILGKFNICRSSQFSTTQPLPIFIFTQMKSATTHSSRHHQNTQTLLLATLNSDTNPVPSHTLRAEPILGTNLHPQEQRHRLFSPRSSLTLDFPAPQRARTIQDSPARFLNQ